MSSERSGANSNVERGPTECDLDYVPGSLQAVVDDAEALHQGQRSAAGDADDAHQAATR